MKCRYIALAAALMLLSGCTENPPTLPETTEGLAESTAVKVEVTEEASLPQNVQVPLLIGDSVEEAVRKLTEAGLAMLKEALPSADLETFSQNPVIQNLAKVLAVRDLVYLVSTKLG